MEKSSLDPNSEELIIFVTPEWISKAENEQKVQLLERENKLALIALDEAHLISEWADFRSAFLRLKELKNSFRRTPLMALSATATQEVEAKIHNALRNPVTEKNSINCPNVTLNVEELPLQKGEDATMQFASRAAEIAGTAPAIIYTDFIADIGPILSSLLESGKDAVGYHGEMDPSERLESYNKWSSGMVNIIVATKAFGMGIDKPDIRNVIRNGVPESILSWTQELGRAGRDGNQARATILYRKSDISHANPWVLNNIGCKERCSEILGAFSKSWKFVQAHLSGICHRRSLLDLFGETDTEAEHKNSCCDVCASKDQYHMKNMKRELAIVVDALDQLGSRGEVKVTEWIRGSKLAWTNEFDKTVMSYGNHCERDSNFWRTFLRQCYVNGFVQMELQSLIKRNGHYSVYGVYFTTDKGRDTIHENRDVMLPQLRNSDKPVRAQGPMRSEKPDSFPEQKHKRIGKGSHILPIIRSCLKESENWKPTKTKEDYHFPGVHPKSQQNSNILFYTPDYTQLEQTAISCGMISSFQRVL